MIGWWLATVARAACPDREVLLHDLEGKVLEGRLEDAQRAADALVEALGCGGPASAELVARMWLAEAAQLVATGDQATADGALQSAARASPTTWNELYGPVLRQRWEKMALTPTGAAGGVAVEDLPEGWATVVDGRAVSLPAPLLPGLHLLQVGPTEGEIVASLRFALPPGIDVVLEPEIPALEPAPAPAPALVPAPIPTPVPLATDDGPRRGRRVAHAVVVGLVGGAMFAGTFATSSAYDRQPSPALLWVNNGLIVASAGLGVTSGVLLVRGLATPR